MSGQLHGLPNTNPTRNKFGNLQPLLVLSDPVKHLITDAVGILPTTNKNRYILICICELSRFAMARRMITPSREILSSGRVSTILIQCSSTIRLRIQMLECSHKRFSEASKHQPRQEWLLLTPN